MRERPPIITQPAITQAEIVVDERFAATVPPSMSPKVWYRWSISKDGLWEDNFSSNVRVGKLRILTGRPGTDPLTGRFRLEDPRPVRPSRVLFLRVFLQSEPASPDDILLHSDDDELRCYADPSMLDGNIEITRCRLNSGDPTPSGTPPTFQLNPNLYDDQHITWMVEFKEGEICPQQKAFTSTFQLAVLRTTPHRRSSQSSLPLRTNSIRTDLTSE